MNLCRACDPHAIVFAGGLATEQLLQQTRRAFDAQTWTILSESNCEPTR